MIQQNSSSLNRVSIKTYKHRMTLFVEENFDSNQQIIGGQPHANSHATSSIKLQSSNQVARVQNYAHLQSRNIQTCNNTFDVSDKIERVCYPMNANDCYDTGFNEAQ